MGLYQGLNRAPQPDAPPRPLAALRTLRVSVEAPAAPARPGFLGRMLGSGPAAARPLSTPRFETVGAGATPLPRQRGLIRLLLVAGLAGLAGWALWAVKPWTELPTLSSELAGLFQAPAPELEQAALERKAKTAEQARLAGLPVVPGGGKPLALYQDGAGKWWRVNAEGVLSPTPSPAAKGNLGLPELRGVAALSRERRGGRELVLQAPAGLLEAALPVDEALASEVRALDLRDPRSLGLLTHDGARAELGTEDLQKKERRLALVLADLAAKKKRAASVDLRYEGTAVVRLASR